jgi:hypothetical protein
MSKATVTLSRFAFNLGSNDRLTLEASLPFHVAYVSATPEQKAQLKHDWQVGYIQGKAAVDAAKAERILSGGKGGNASKASIDAIDKSYSSFKYHVVRKPKAKAKAAPVQANQRISKAHRAAAEAYLAQFDNLADAIKALEAVAK